MGAGAVVALLVVEASGLSAAWIVSLAAVLGAVLSLAVWKSVSQLP